MRKVTCKRCKGAGRLYLKMGSMEDKCPDCFGEGEVDPDRIFCKKTPPKRKN